MSSNLTETPFFPRQTREMELIMQKTVAPQNDSHRATLSVSDILKFFFRKLKKHLHFSLTYDSLRKNLRITRKGLFS